MKQAISTYWESIMRWVYYQRSDSAAVRLETPRVRNISNDRDLLVDGVHRAVTSTLPVRHSKFNSFRD